MSRYSFYLSLICLGMVAFLGWLAYGGSIPAMIFLVMLTTFLLMAAGAGMALTVQRMANEKSQQDFVANAKENLALMQAQQRVQNMQNQTIMEQLTKVARLPELGPGNGNSGLEAFIIDQDVFGELEE